MWKTAALAFVLAALVPSSAFYLLMGPKAVGKSADVPCDGSFSCPDNTQCCRHPLGLFTCCPYPDGVCCLDGLHCCPARTYCDLTYGKCLTRGPRHPFAPRLPLVPVPSAVMVEAEEAKAEEPSVGLKLHSGDVELSFPDLPVSPMGEQEGSSVSVQSRSGDEKVSVVACDGTTTCPDGTTCCKHPAGTWTCCPLFAAVCCLDGFHCCPAGTYCDLTYTSCLQQGLRYPFAPWLPPVSLPSIQLAEASDHVEE